MANTALLIDGSSFCYRAYYAIRKLTTSYGKPTNAVYGFITILERLLRELAPTHLAVAFDRPEPTFRHQRFAAYKSERPPMPEDLVAQLGTIKEVLEAYRIPVCEQPGYEADDILATLARRLAAAGFEVIIVTSDKDSLQLVDRRIRVYNPHREGGTFYDAEAVKRRFGVPPERMVDLIALMGDPTDNIPGVPGIGEKTARELLARFDSLDELLARLNEVPSQVRRETLAHYADQARLSRDLAVAQCEMPLAVTPEALRRAEPDYQRLAELFGVLEFRSLQKSLPVPVAAAPPHARVAMQQVRTAADCRTLQEELLRTGRFAWEWEWSHPDGPYTVSHIRGLGLAWKPGDIAYHAWADPARDALTWRPCWTDPTVTKVGYEIKRTHTLLASCGITLAGPLSDVALAAYLLDPSQGNRPLAVLSQTYLHVSLPTSPLEEGAAAAAASETLLQLAAHLERELEAQGLTRLYQEVELPLTAILARMEQQGVAIDRAALERLSTTVGRELTQLTGEITALAGRDFNLQSHQQLAEILFTELKLPVLRRTKTGPSTDMETLKKLAARHPLPTKLLRFRELAKLKSTFVDGLLAHLDPTTGRLHTSFNQTATATGRLSSSDPNVQNIPVRTELGRQIRRSFIPSEPSWQILSADYSQIELRILAHLSQDPQLLRAFQEGMDIHVHTATLIYGVEPGAVNETMRDAAKTVNFGILYGMSAHGLAQELGMADEEARVFIEAYYARYEGVKRYLDTLLAQARTQGYVTTLLGRRRYLPEIHHRHMSLRQFAERTAINTPVQGTAADLIKLAMLRVDRALAAKRLRARMVLQVHDELVFETPPEEVAVLSRLAEREMSRALDLAVPIVVKVAAGPNWLEVTPVPDTLTPSAGVLPVRTPPGRAG